MLPSYPIRNAARRLASLWRFRAQRAGDQLHRTELELAEARAHVRELEGGADGDSRLTLLEDLVREAQRYMRLQRGDPPALEWLERAQTALLEIPATRRYMVGELPGRPLLRTITDRYSGYTYTVDSDRLEDRLRELFAAAKVDRREPVQGSMSRS